MEKKRGVQSTDTGKKLTCYKSLLLKTISNKMKAAKGFPFPGENRPIKSIVKTGRSEVKPPISSPSELGVSSGSEDEGWWEESGTEADAECLYCAGLFTEDHGVEE
jgi:hypothetical protein